MLFNDELITEDLIEHYAKRVITQLPFKWTWWRCGDQDSEAANLVYLRQKDAYLFLSRVAIDLNEHEIIFSDEEWPNKAYYPYDKIEEVVLNHFWKRLS